MSWTVQRHREAWHFGTKSQAASAADRPHEQHRHAEHKRVRGSGRSCKGHRLQANLAAQQSSAA